MSAGLGEYFQPLAQVPIIYDLQISPEGDERPKNQADTFNRSRRYLLYMPSEYPRMGMSVRRIDRDPSSVEVGVYRIRPPNIPGWR